MDSPVLTGRELTRPALVAVALAALTLYAVAFDQGLLAGTISDAASDSGGMLHAAFHDTRHLLGVPCH